MAWDIETSDLCSDQEALASSRCLRSRNEIVKLYPRPFSFGSKRAKTDRVLLWL